MSDTLLQVRGLGKKFSQDIKYNMYYGLLDLLGLGPKVSSDPASRSSRSHARIGISGRDSDLRKYEFWALQQIDFDLHAGDILGVVGMNGSGKTTLMRLLAGIYTTDYGSIQVKPGIRTTAIFALRSGMQMLFSGRENIYIKGAMYGMSREEIDAKMEFIEDFSELGKKLDRPFGNYSSGMKARLAYSVALATDPNIFIIDEALAVGDSAFKAKCFDNLREFAAEPGKAVIFVSNHTRKVLKVANRCLVIDEGRKVYDSPDVKEALEYYILNCFKTKGEERQQLKLEKIRNYEWE
ncbi:MAG: ABC transporter ATP-binding protein [Bacteroidota bacterium]